MNRSALDLWVGAFVAVGIAAILFLALKVGNLIDFGSAPGYRLEARFDNIGGLKVRASVKAAGVVVGRVESIKLDPGTYQAVVTLQDRPGLSVHDGHDCIDPDVRSPGRCLHRARRGRRPADAGRRRERDQDAIGDRPREADRPVPVRQGRDGGWKVTRKSSEWRRRCNRVATRCAVLAVALVAGCAPGPNARRPARTDEPHALPGARRGRHGRRAAGGAGVRRLRAPADPHGRVERLQQHQRPVLGESTASCRASSTRPATTSAAWCSTPDSASAGSSISRR